MARPGGAPHDDGMRNREERRSPMRIKRPGLLLGILTVLGAGLVASLRPATAVPVFARKYQTSCQTCHTIFPKLNPFGEAFRLNGYRMPGETEEMVKEKPVSLGADAYKRMWPEMVYPSHLPSNVPFAMNVKLASVYSSSVDDQGRQITHNDFQFPQEVNLFSAGTFGEHFSFFGELTYAENSDGSSEVEIEHAQIGIDSPFGPKNLVHFKVGKFSPDYADGFQEMWLMTDNGIDTLFSYSPIGYRGGTGVEEDGAGISLPAMVKGIEIYGVANHRLFYTVGVVNGIANGANGTNDANSSKDAYARVDYKIGGMGLDGDTTGVQMPPENWKENSLRVGVLGYTGNGKNVDFPVTDSLGNPFNMQDLRYNRYGVYASWYWGSLNVFGAAVHGTDRLQLRDPDSGVPLDETTRTYDAWFAQADYVITPPFQASLRYENLRVADPTVPSIRTLNANFSFLARANIKAMLEYNRDLRESQNYTLSTVLRFAY
jgi:hypothetical protein